MASQQPFPLMPPKSTELRLMHMDEYVYTATPSTMLYKYVDALCGTAGAGALVNEVFLARLGAALETIYFNDLDYIFGKVSFLARSPAESYPYNPMTDMLTSDQWDEVRTKDAWYRARVKDFFAACGLGGTPDGIRMCVQAALAVDCDIYEVWRYLDNFGITESLGRAPETARNELVVRPHKGSLAPGELRLIRDMLAKICPLDTIITVNLNGLAVQSPIPVNAAASDSEYYEVQKMVTATPALAQMPPPELLPIDLLPTQTWLYQAQTDPQLAPYTAFNISSEYGYYYLTGGGSRSPIDSVTYGTINPNRQQKITVFEMTGSYEVPFGRVSIPANSWFSNNLDPAFFQWVSVPYPADQYPTNDAISTGVGNLTNLINATSGPFVLVGFSLGATIISNVYDQIRTGSLVSRFNDFLYGFAFGNPRRSLHATFPNCPDPGGHGVDADNLLTAPGSNWWEFALPGDIIAVCGDDRIGQQRATVFESLLQHYAGDLNAVTTQITGVPGAWYILQNELDLLFGYNNETGPHFQYPTHSPVPGDTRSCVQIAADAINNLKLPTPGAVNSSTPTLTYGAGTKDAYQYSVVCYEVSESPTGSTYFASNLDRGIRYIQVNWPSNTQLPIEAAITQGVFNLIGTINNNPGPFMFVGTGIGAEVTSIVYDEIRSGSLLSRRDDFVAAVAFGNPRRPAGAIFPGGTDPGGHGISSTLLSSPESLWWEFANPGDILATEGDDSSGALMTDLYDTFTTVYTGDPNAVTSAFSTTATVNVAPLVNALINVVIDPNNGSGLPNTHLSYATTTPIDGDPRTSFQIARDYLNTFVNAGILQTVLPSTDPMASYLPALNYQTFDTTGQYTAPIPYEKADSPDNYPGGKYGIHPDTAPALNPDGTPYTFQYVSQAVYISQKVVSVLAAGGLANDTTYQLPLSPLTSSAQVFYPEYAIAYYPPAKDSTVSASITARHGDPSNQITLEPRDPANFVRN